MEQRWFPTFLETFFGAFNQYARELKDVEGMLITGYCMTLTKLMMQR